jgi:UDP-2-acetamido-2,6-beta-L-arabino-hexul-4-ose reductase
MIVGSGQIASAFGEAGLSDDVVLFASGVSDSGCEDEAAFARERRLLRSTLQHYPQKRLVYFSSCALSTPDYPLNAYYRHKRQMEELIGHDAREYYIFRVPQLFGRFKRHKTLINYLYFSILDEMPFTVYDEAYRYVIGLDELVRLVRCCLAHLPASVTVDLANPHRYSIIEIVELLEQLIGKRATYEVAHKQDGYWLEFETMRAFLSHECPESFGFGPGYLERALGKIIQEGVCE